MEGLYAQGYESGQSITPEMGEMEQGSSVGAGTNAPGYLGGPTDINGAGGTGYNAFTQEVDPNSLSDAQLARILGEDSALTQRARQEGVLMAARRGLQNSSIAAGTAFGALTDRATPLALSNAEILHNQRITNQNAINTAKQLTAQLLSTEGIAEAGITSEEKKLAAQISSTESMFTAEQANQMEQFNTNWVNQAETLAAQMEQQTQQFNISQQNAIDMRIIELNTALNEQYLRGTQAMDLATIQGQFQTLISQNQMAAALFESGMTSIGAAMANHEIPPSQIATYVNIQQNLIQSGLQLLADMNNINFEDTDFTDVFNPGEGFDFSDWFNSLSPEARAEYLASVGGAGGSGLPGTANP